MKDFVFQIPTRVVFGNGVASRLGEEVAAFGRRALFLTGCRSLKQSGCYRLLLDSLQAAGLEVVEFSGIRPNPTVGQVQEIIEIARSAGVQTVVAAGGGSVIDAGKAVAAGLCVQHSVWKFFTGKKSVRTSLPVVAVPTLPASSSEMNPAMVLTNEQSRQKFGFANRLLYPKVALLDPQLTSSVPPEHTVYGTVDALCHLIEFFLTAEDRHSQFTDRLAADLARGLFENCGRILADPAGLEARAEFMWTVTLSLNGLTGAGRGKLAVPVHLIEHSLSGLYDTPHGAGLAVLLPAWLDYFRNREPARLASFFKPLYGLEHLDDQAAAARGTEKLRLWLARHNAPRCLADLGIPRETIPLLAGHTEPLARIWRLRDYPVDVVQEILEKCC